MEKYFLGLVILLILGSSALLAKNAVAGSPTFTINPPQIFESLGSRFESYLKELTLLLKEEPSPSIAATEATTSGHMAIDEEGKLATPRSTKRPQQADRVTPKPTTQPQRACYRATAYHLDGSTSNRCYTSSDASAIKSHASAYLSAKTFYQFHLDGVARYQAEYERTGSSIYLDAKASSQENANQEKAKMDQAVLEMQTIEQRGW